MPPHPPEELLTIVIPALNEEEAIARTVSRCLDARREICAEAGLADVEIIVVSDGSTDRTAGIARGFDEVRVIEFAENQGYGAAIGKGFAEARGTLLGFLDADGTCDPRYFGPMCRLVTEEDAEIVLGARLGPESHMPALRRIGNRVYAVLLGALCGRTVSDTASGMRVLRREAYEEIAPLPKGLHFTPAMSARALINQMNVREVPMTYAERIGTSKLRVLGDGLRFLRTIIAGILCYRPDRLFAMAFVACLLVVLMMGAYPMEHYLRHRVVEEWMIYRFVACFLLGSTGFLLLCATALSHALTGLRPRGRPVDSFWSAASAQLFRGRTLAGFVGICVVLAAALIWPGVIEYVRSARCTLHWSRMIVGAFFLLAAVQALVTAVLVELVTVWARQKSSLTPKSRAWPVGQAASLPRKASSLPPCCPQQAGSVS